MSEEYLEQKHGEISKFIRKHDLKKIFKVLSDVKNTVSNQIVFYDFVGDLFVNRLKFFLTVFYKIYNKNIVNLLGPEELFEMEGHILEKHCLYPNEILLKRFNGKYVIGPAKEVGRLYLTSDRIITQGSVKSTGVPMVTRSVVQGQMNKHIHKKLMNKIQPTDLPCFGYPHSILGFNKVILKGNQVHLKVPLGKIVIQAFGDTGIEVAKVVYNTIIEANNLAA